MSNPVIKRGRHILEKPGRRVSYLLSIRVGKKPALHYREHSLASEIAGPCFYCETRFEQARWADICLRSNSQAPQVLLQELLQNKK